MGYFCCCLDHVFLSHFVTMLVHNHQQKIFFFVWVSWCHMRCPCMAVVNTHLVVHQLPISADWIWWLPWLELWLVFIWCPHRSLTFKEPLDKSLSSNNVNWTGGGHSSDSLPSGVFPHKINRLRPIEVMTLGKVTYNITHWPISPREAWLSLYICACLLFQDGWKPGLICPTCLSC